MSLVASSTVADIKTIPLYAAGALAVFILLLIRVERRLSAYPGPFLARFTDWWKVYHLHKRDYPETLRRWHEKHGPIIRIGPNHLSIGDPNEVVKVYRTSPVLNKGSMYKVLMGWFKGKNVAGIEGVFDEKEHTAMRRVLGPYFTSKSVHDHESRIDHTAMEFMDHMERLKTFDISRWFPYYTMDSMNQIAFSADLGFMKNATDVGGTMNAIRLINAVWCYVLAIPSVFMWFARLMSYVIGPGGPFVMLGVQRVEGRLKSQKEGDLLDNYVTAHRSHPELFPPERLLGMTLTTILGGSDTTAFTLTYTIHDLLKRPDAMNRLASEIHEAVHKGELSYPPTLKQLYQLPYLHAVVNEGLRCADLIRLTLDRVVPPGGLPFCGSHIPGGTTIGCNMQVIHYNKKIYGHDAEIFRPDRWIETSDENRRAMDRVGMWFGNGKHGCLGLHFARAEMLKVLAMMFMKFKISDVDPKARITSVEVNAARRPTPYFVSVTPKNLPGLV